MKQRIKELIQEAEEIQIESKKAREELKTLFGL